MSPGGEIAFRGRLEAIIGPCVCFSDTIPLFAFTTFQVRGQSCVVLWLGDDGTDADGRFTSELRQYVGKTWLLLWGRVTEPWRYKGRNTLLWAKLGMSKGLPSLPTLVPRVCFASTTSCSFVHSFKCYFVAFMRFSMTHISFNIHMKDRHSHRLIVLSQLLGEIN